VSKIDEDLTTPEHLLHRGVHGRADHGLTGLWLRPVRGPFNRAAETVDKPIGDLTMPEAMDWVVVLGGRRR
jgi:hypothetical protein